MTETIKSIIELIEPYMDKTLSEWCLYKFEDEIYSMSKWEALNSSAFLESQEAWDTNILWHYDITAVLKYIKKKTIIRIFDVWDNYYSFELINKIWEKIWGFCIPNKPFHLYTDEEDKQLLDLLIKHK